MFEPNTQSEPSDEQVAPMQIGTTKEAAREESQNWSKYALGATSPKMFLTRTAAAQIRPAAVPALGTDGAKMIKRLATIAAGLYQASGQIEAQYLRRPNTLVSLYTPVIAPGATTAFSIQPGVGNSFYRLLGLIADDTQCSVFGFTQLRVGGQDHVNFSQTTPTAPVANAVPWAIYALRESSFQANLAPWTGQVFDANTPITGTVANMTVAASGDAITIAARIVFLAQTDPCAFRTPQAQMQSQQFFSRIRRFGSGLMLGSMGGSLTDLMDYHGDNGLR